jgi:hypothetical protein
MNVFILAKYAWRIFIVERHGKFLVIDTKPPGADLSGYGQTIMLEELPTLPNWRILVLRGPRNLPQECKYFDPTTKQSSKWKPATLETVKALVRNWFEWADELAPTCPSAWQINAESTALPTVGRKRSEISACLFFGVLGIQAFRSRFL